MHAPRLLIHGHQHVNRETLSGGTRVVGVHGSRVVEVPAWAAVGQTAASCNRSEDGTGGAV